MSDLRPTIFVLFGATGDLARRLVLPAFAALAATDLMPEKWVLIGNGRKPEDDAWFADHVRDVLDDDKLFAAVREHLMFAGNGFSVDDPGDLPDTMARARERAGEDAAARALHRAAALDVRAVRAGPRRARPRGRDRGWCSRSRTAPARRRSPTSRRWCTASSTRTRCTGSTTSSGRRRRRTCTSCASPTRIVGDVWCNRGVEQVQIDVPETLDIDDRAEFYDATGATLDMVVTHLFQVAAEIAMEPPASLAAGDLLDARESVIACFRPLDPDDVVLGQYEGYRDVEGVAADSDDRHVHRGAAVGRHRPLARRAVPAAHRQAPRRLRAAGHARAKTPPDGLVADPPPTTISLSLKGSGELDITVVTKKPGPDIALTARTAAAAAVATATARTSLPTPP